MKFSKEIIDETLEKYRPIIGRHFSTYRNHVYRVLLLCQQLDNEQKNHTKYAIAAVFHDLGIWTNNTFDYLEPSILLAKEYLLDNDKIEWIEEVSLIIGMHHKRSKYTGPYEQTVEIFRRADWIDVSMGLKSYSISRAVRNEILNKYPNLGFHRFLIIQTLKNLVKSPLDPLPMFKK